MVRYTHQQKISTLTGNCKMITYITVAMVTAID